jgi:hypothetical protein
MNDNETSHPLRAVCAAGATLNHDEGNDWYGAPSC